MLYIKQYLRYIHNIKTIQPLNAINKALKYCIYGINFVSLQCDKERDSKTIKNTESWKSTNHSTVSTVK